MSTNRLPAILFSALCAINCAGVQTVPQQPAAAVAKPPEQQQRVSDAALESLIVRAKGARAETAADVLLRVVELGLVTERERKRELIEEAFRRAGDAQRPVKMKAWAGMVDTRSGYLAKAYELNLDKLSLQARAVRSMLAVDQKSARALSGEVAPPKLPPLGCDDSLAYDVTATYDALKQIARTSFNAKEKALGRHVDFVLPYVEELSSPSQITPALDLITSLDTTPDQLARLVYAFGAALKKVPDDPRSFFFATRYDGAAGRARQLVETGKQKGVQTAALAESFRAYVVRNLGSSQCAETQTQRGKAFIDGYVAQLNEWVAPPIGAEEVRPAKVEGEADIHEYWSTPKASALMRQYKALRFNGRAELTEAERGTDAWAHNLQEFLNELERWGEADEETEADYFHQRCSLYEALLEIAPAGPARVSILQDYIRYLKETNVRNDSRIEWMQHASSLIDPSRSIGGARQPGLRQMLRDSGDATFQLYALLAEAQPAEKQAATAGGSAQ